MSKIKIKQKDFLKILKTNSINSPFNIDEYNKQSVINCRLKLLKSYQKFFIEYTCKNCKTTVVKDLCYTLDISKITYCKSCKTKLTNLERYGATSPAKNKQVQEKMRQTCLERYGVPSTFESNIVKEKIKQTCLEKYGVEYISQTDEFKESVKQTCLKKYGETTPLKSEEIKEKIKQTNLEKYGAENPSQSEIIKEKKKKTCLNNLGVEYPTQDKNVMNKVLSSRQESVGSLHISYNFVYDGISFDSSWELYFYLYHTLKKHKIIREPTIFYYPYNKEIHSYIPDFKVGNKYYEIKGDQFIIRYKNGKIRGMKCPFDNSKNELFNAKYKCMKKHKVNIISNEKINKYIEFVNKQCGVNFIEQFKKV